MIINLLLNLIIATIGVLFSWLPTVSTLPLIGGYDIDGVLSTGMTQFNTIAVSFWSLLIVFQGFLYLMGYYILKLTLRFFLGHRTPIN